MMPTPEELDGPFAQFVDSIQPVAEAAAECYRRAQVVAMNPADLPHCYLARQWIVWSQALSQVRFDTETTECLSSLRSIALCMAATHFTGSNKFIEVITAVTDMYHHIQAAQTNGETKQ